MSAASALSAVHLSPETTVERCCAAVQIMDGEKGMDRETFGPYLCLLEPKYLAVIAIHGALVLLSSRILSMQYALTIRPAVPGA